MEALEEIEKRLQRLEQGIRLLKEAYLRATEEQKALLLKYRQEKRQLRQRLFLLREKVSTALSYGRGDPNLDNSRAATDRPGAPNDNSAFREAAHED